MASTPSPGGFETLPSSPSSTGAQNAKSRRYDRQLRLWGDHGQVALEKSRVCVVGATATATEVLKSLVLPGVGHFTILDGKKVTGEDIGNNFFLDKESLGKVRGSVATRLLLELNPEVRGDYVDESLEQVLSERKDFFLTFDLVILTEIVNEKPLINLSTFLWEHNVPLMVVRTYGLLGYIRLQVREHTIIESHPENILQDLRLNEPFKELVDFMDSQIMEEMSKNEYMHVPYAVILYKYLQQWKATHEGKPPKNYNEKRDFKTLIKSTMRSRADVESEELENFEEALRAVNTALQPSVIPSAVESIVQDPKCLHLTNKSEDFWILARGLKDFLEKAENPKLPLPGSLPDMFADSARYIKLANIYRNQAAVDSEKIHKSVQTHLESVGRSAESITEPVVKKFCKEASNLRVHRDSGSIADEMSGKIQSKELTETLEHTPDSELAYYLILRGVERFLSDFNILPGSVADDVEPDIGRLKSCVSKVLSDGYAGVSSSVIKDDFVYEVCRLGAAEPHALAAFLGGCAAHECIKLLARQYVPIDNLFLFNAMTMNTLSLKI